jgi:DNA-binding NtrC family response regulator
LAQDDPLTTVSGVNTRRQARALLLEGNSAVREIVSEALSELGFDVVAAEARRDALDHLLDDPDPDMIVIDLVGDAAGGEAFLSFVAEHQELASIPLIVMTDGAEPPRTAAQAVALVKPFDADALARAVRQAMAGRATPAESPHPAAP